MKKCFGRASSWREGAVERLLIPATLDSPRNAERWSGCALESSNS